MERVGIDVLGPLPKTENGNKYLVVIMDYFTKWPEVFPWPNQEAVTIPNVVVKEVVCRFGVPKQLHSDQGRNFCSNVFAEMCKLLGITKTQTTPYHPQSDGLVERYNRTIEAQISIFVDTHQTDWDEYIPYLLMAYRTAVQESTKFTPSRLTLGREIRLPIDLLLIRPKEENFEDISHYASKLSEHLQEVHEFARKNLRIASNRMKHYYDVNSCAKELKVGDAVWLHSLVRKKGLSTKLMKPWTGPYIIIKKLNDLVYKIQLTQHSKPKIVHRNRLWSYTSKHEPDWIPKETTNKNTNSVAISNTEVRRSSRVAKKPTRFEP